MAFQPVVEADSKQRPPYVFPSTLAGALRRCWDKAAAPSEWQITRERFEEALSASVTSRFAERTSEPAQVEAYLESLHATDLALALACRSGSEAGWEFFMRRYRHELYAAARAVVGRGGVCNMGSEELADSLYADLYGMRETEAGRKSLFEYFHGRSKLSTWLRAVLAQRYVDEIRRTQKLQPMEDAPGLDGFESASISPAQGKPSGSPDPEREKYLAALQAALVIVLGILDTRERLRLAYYYADGRTLAEIGSLMQEHEATVSRKLERTRREIRRAVEARLREHNKMTEGQVQACFAYARGEWPFDLTGILRASPEGKFSGDNRSKGRESAG